MTGISALALTCLLCACKTAASAADETISCRDWMNLPARTRTAVVSDRLRAEFGEPGLAALRACLAALAQPIAERIDGHCLRADTGYAAASAQAVSAAADYCHSRDAQSPP